MAEMNSLTCKPRLSFWTLWNISFGFFGVQIAYALQSANVSRIFATLGADPHSLSYFWILPPLAGIIVQPIVGSLSDRTWTRYRVAGGGTGHVYVAECRQFHTLHQCHALRRDIPYVVGYIHQYGNAAL